jgi:2-(1,2-epoxy-1,2-dihydrophenyl)acetyl-CoA isomerase
MDDDLLHRVEGGVAWITLNRPDAGNAITPDQRNAMIDLLEAADADPAVRAVVIGAKGKHFCTGADLRGGQSPEQPARAVGSVMRTIATGAQRLIAAALDCRKPVVASVGGTAAGLGAHLAFACDLIVAAESASFIEVFVRRGIAPDGGGAYLLPRLVGLQRAKELIFLGDRVPASEAHRIGLVNRVVPDAELEAAVAELAERLAKAPTVAVGLAKRMLNHSFEADRASAFEEEAMVQELVMGSADAREGIASFVERRESAFEGR